MYRRTKFLIGSFAVFLLAVGFSLGVIATAVVEQNQPRTLSETVGRLTTASADFRTFETVWNNLHRAYIETDVDDQALLYGATQGLVNALSDPYSVFLNPDETAEFQQEIEGTFEGVGMELGIKDDRITVIAPLADSPAEQAGLKAGDIILVIDGIDASGLQLYEAVDMIRGAKGTTLRLTVQRGDQSREFSVVRDTIKVESVNSRLDEVNGRLIGYIQITHFSHDTDSLFQRQARDLLGRGASAFILDLRSNPGGLLDQSVAVASAFIADGVVVKEKVRDGGLEEITTSGQAWLADQPLVVLIDGGSASAAEIVAGALQDADRARLVGTTTYGKGTVQDYQVLSDGSSLKLTIAEWLTPAGRSINQAGIEPDIEVIADPDDASDVQLLRAQEILTAP